MQIKRCSILRRVLVGTLIFAITLGMSSPPKGWAMLAPAQVSSDVPATNVTRTADLKTIQTALESKILRQRLADFKLTPEQIDGRLSRLSDAQVHQMAKQIRTVNAGGDGGGFVISLLFIGILMVLFMYVLRRV